MSGQLRIQFDFGSTSLLGRSNCTIEIVHVKAYVNPTRLCTFTGEFSSSPEDSTSRFRKGVVLPVPSHLRQPTGKFVGF